MNVDVVCERAAKMKKESTKGEKEKLLLFEWHAERSIIYNYIYIYILLYTYIHKHACASVNIYVCEDRVFT